MPHLATLEAVTRILARANRGADRKSLFIGCLQDLADVFQCPSAAVWLTDGTVYRVARPAETSVLCLQCGPPATDPPVRMLAELNAAAAPEPGRPNLQNRTWWSADVARTVPETGAARSILELLVQVAGEGCTSLLAAAFDLQSGPPGLLVLASDRPDHFDGRRRSLFARVGPLFDIALANWRVGQALRERVKELGCLYRMARIDATPDAPLDGLLNEIAAILPAAWLHSRDARVRIELDGRHYGDSDFPIDRPVMDSPIEVENNPRGRIAIAYIAEHAPLDEGPFLAEERSLMDTIARELGRIVARKDFEHQKARMRERLAHTDRLNMMGQLSAAIAHEINEPLTAMLGYAQLAAKCAGLPEPARADIDRITATCLHAREIVRRLLLFSRDMPARAEAVSVNRVLGDSLEFFRTGCARENIVLTTRLTRGHDVITIDPARLRQVFSNLILNAIQAMPRGGRLTLTTRRAGRRLEAVVEDTGIGMSEDVLEKIFIPFYTTKPCQQGTGLGLPVVREIVAENAGRLQVQSTPGRGTRFTLSFPLHRQRKTEEAVL